MRYLLTLAALFMMLPLMAIGTPADAGTSCNRKDVNIDGNDFAGDPFSFPARLGGPAPDPNIGLSAEDCVDEDRFDEAKRDARRSAGVAAAMDAFAAQEGLNLTLGYANIGLEDDVNAAAGVVTYKHHFADPGVIHGITGKVGFGADTTGDEMGASVGMTISFGTF